MIHLILLLGLGAPQASGCALSIHAVSAQDTVDETPLIAPDHVQSVQVSTDRVTGQPLWIVRLDATGAEINSNYSLAHLGERLAVFCGAREISRPLIAAPSGDEFAVTFAPSDP